MKHAKWPVALFLLTLVLAIVSAAISLSYYRYTNKLQEQAIDLDTKQRLYREEIAALQEKLKETKTEYEVREVPVTRMRQDCSQGTGPLGLSLCINVPEVRIESQKVPVVSTTVNPEVKSKLEQKQQELEQLTQTTVATQSKQISLKESVEASKGLITVIVSAIALLAALFVVLSKQYDPDTQKWAYGTVGTILGFWLKYPQRLHQFPRGSLTEETSPYTGDAHNYSTPS